MSLAQRYNLFTRLALLGLFAGPGLPRREELWQSTATKVVTKHPKRSGCIAKAMRDFG
jgi:hypothetical protein